MRRPLLAGLLATASALIVPAGAPAAELAFVSDRDGNTEIYLMQDDGSAQRNLTAHADDDRDPAWSPDGGRIVFARGFAGDADLWVMNADGSGQRRLAGTAGADRAPTWSPDGQRIAFVGDREGLPELHVVDADGGGLRTLTATGGAAGEPDWSPDGGRIAYFREDDARVHVIGADGTGDRAVGGGDDRADGDPSWSPDGARLAFASLTDPARDLDVWTMGADGSAPTAVLASPARDMSPDWSADGRLAFASDRDGELDVYTAASDGSGVRRLTSSAGEDGMPAWRPAPVADTPQDTAAGGGDEQAPILVPGAGAERIGGRGVRISLLRRSSVRLRGRRLRIVLRYRLSAAAVATLDVRAGRRRVVRLRRRGRRGVNVIRYTRRVRHPKRFHGRYTVVLRSLRRI